MVIIKYRMGGFARYWWNTVACERREFVGKLLEIKLAGYACYSYPA